MAQGDRPARHSRHSSRITTSSKAAGTDSHEGRAGQTDSTRDAATVAFVKRTLCSKPTKTGSLTDAPADANKDKSLEDLLPPLTSSNDIDVQLYAIIAIILAQFVQSWYNRITPDSDFVGEIVQIIAHCTRGLEERLRHVDLETLLFDELPHLLSDHLYAIRVAREACHVRHEPHADDEQIRSIYSILRPHSALLPPPIDEATSVVQHENEVDWSQLLVCGIMPLILPPEDLLNPTLNVLVSETFSAIIVHNAILGKASEPWLIWEGITKVIYMLLPKTQTRKDANSSPTSRLEQFGLLASVTVGAQDPHGAQRSTFDVITLAFWSMLQYAVLTWTCLRALVTALTQVSTAHPRPRRVSSNRKASGMVHMGAEGRAENLATTSPKVRPIVSMRLWSCLEQLTSLQQRMPWLSGGLSLLQWLSLHGPGQVCSTDGALERLISAQLHEKLLNPALLPPLLQAIRSAVFPDFALGPPRVPPTSDEVVEIKRECARAIVDAIPEPIRTYYFVTKNKDVMQKHVEDRLEPFSDAYINKSLIVSALELIVVRLFPELGESVSDV